VRRWRAGPAQAWGVTPEVVVLPEWPAAKAAVADLALSPSRPRRRRSLRPVSILTDEARRVIESGRLAHLSTTNPDGSPHVTVVWVGLEGDELVCGHMGMRQKLRNVQRDARVALSLETGERNAMGLDEYLVVEGTARVTEGGAADLLQRLAHVYLGPDVRFPPGGDDDPPPGYVLRITPERLGGVGPWSSAH
jgi:PPOX class probable F420-dependent enzyme